MTEREALKLALEALEVATTPLAKDRQEVLRARDAIREALAQPAQQEERGVEYWTSKYHVPLGYELVKKNPSQHARDAVTWTPETGYVFKEQPEQTAIGKSVADEEAYWRNDMLSGD